MDEMAGRLPIEIIADQRDGRALSPSDIESVVQGLISGSWSDSQVAAWAMAVVLRGMDVAQRRSLTMAMARSGRVLSWSDKPGLHGPILDKHSTGGVGDKVSLVLAPLVAACGGVVPMISGRGLAHTGGTLDKLEALPNYNAYPTEAQLLSALQQAGCAIIGASEDLAPADRRLYAIRDVTATVESVSLVTSSILSKKLAAGLQALVMDVKVGSGSFTPTLAQAQELAQSLVSVAASAGLPTRALITDMNQVLGHTVGHALEVQEALDVLMNRPCDERFRTLCLQLSAHLLHLGGLQADVQAAERALDRALKSGAAAERFARMVAALGGPSDVLKDARLSQAPVCIPVPAPFRARVVGLDVKALGLAVMHLGGGRMKAGQPIDPVVGLTQVQGLGCSVGSGQPLALVQARTQGQAEDAVARIQAAFELAEEGSERAQAMEVPPLVHEVVYEQKAQP